MAYSNAGKEAINRLCSEARKDDFLPGIRQLNASDVKLVHIPVYVPIHRRRPKEGKV